VNRWLPHGVKKDRGRRASRNEPKEETAAFQREREYRSSEIYRGREREREKDGIKTRRKRKKFRDWELGRIFSYVCERVMK
jgi:hypothetical protein